MFRPPPNSQPKPNDLSHVPSTSDDGTKVGTNGTLLHSQYSIINEQSPKPHQLESHATHRPKPRYHASPYQLLTLVPTLVPTWYSTLVRARCTLDFTLTRWSSFVSRTTTLNGRARHPTERAATREARLSTTNYCKKFDLFWLVQRRRQLARRRQRQRTKIEDKNTSSLKLNYQQLVPRYQLGWYQRWYRVRQHNHKWPK